MPTKTLVFAGCLNTPVPHFATANGRGIATFSFDGATGESRFLAETISVANPTYLALLPARRLLYATSEVFGETEGVVSAYGIDVERGVLSPINRRRTRGSLSAHCNTDCGGQGVFVANYAHETPNENPGRHVVGFPVADNGSIGERTSEFVHGGTGPDKARQSVAHAHCSVPSHDDRFLLVSDLGMDSMLTYRLDASVAYLEGPVNVAQMPPGSGPRHFVFHPDGCSVYVANELSATISRLAFDTTTGVLTLIETIQGLPGHPPTFTPPADIHIAPDGRFLYVSFRGANCIAMYSLDERDGAIRFHSARSTEGRTPRSFTLAPDGAFLLVANQDSDSIVTFARDAATGELRDKVDAISIGTPMCLKTASFQ